MILNLGDIYIDTRRIIYWKWESEKTICFQFDCKKSLAINVDYDAKIMIEKALKKYDKYVSDTVLDMSFLNKNMQRIEKLLIDKGVCK